MLIILRISSFKDAEVLPDFLITNVSSGDAKTLEILGVRDSSVFLSNCTIWVEGVTDRMHLRHYLLLYQEHLRIEHLKEGRRFTPYKEDTHFSFVEYGGGNLVHFNFDDTENSGITVKRITKNVLLIADYDSGKERKHEDLRSVLGDNYYPLSGREIENLVSPEILKEIIIQFESKKGNPDISFPSFRHASFLRKYMGSYIEKTLFGPGKLKYSYAEKEGSGTIRDKMNFAKTVISLTASWDDLSMYQQDLAKKVYAFVKAHNG